MSEVPDLQRHAADLRDRLIVAEARAQAWHRCQLLAESRILEANPPEVQSLRDALRDACAYAASTIPSNPNLAMAAKAMIHRWADVLDGRPR